LQERHGREAPSVGSRRRWSEKLLFLAMEPPPHNVQTGAGVSGRTERPARCVAAPPSGVCGDCVG